MFGSSISLCKDTHHVDVENLHTGRIAVLEEHASLHIVKQLHALIISHRPPGVISTALRVECVSFAKSEQEGLGSHLILTWNCN